MRSRFRNSAYLAAGTALLLGALAGCGGGSSPTSSPSSPSPQTTGSQYQALVPLIDCLRQHGLNLPGRPTLADVRQVYQALPADQQQSVVAACRGLLPAGLASAGASATPSS